MITTLFIAVMCFAVYRTFIFMEEWYADKSRDFAGVIEEPGFWKKILIPFLIAFAIWYFFKSKIKLK